MGTQIALGEDFRLSLEDNDYVGIDVEVKRLAKEILEETK